MAKKKMTFLDELEGFVERSGADALRKSMALQVGRAAFNACPQNAALWKQAREIIDELDADSVGDDDEVAAVLSIGFAPENDDEEVTRWGRVVRDA